MKKIILTAVLTALITLGVFAGGLSVDAFMPPAQGGTTEIVDAVQKTDSNEVSAQNLQDGLNYGSKLIWEEQGGDGYKAVKFPSGTGYIAGATAFYTVYPNINATLLAKRAAYLEAYYKAKANMLQGLKGYFTKKETEFSDILVAIDNTEKNVGAQLMTQKETIEQVANGLLRGYVTYEVMDEAGDEDGQVYVSIAITPKTIETVNQVTNGIIFSRDTAYSLQQILANIQNGVVPPVGGKIIIMPESGQTAVVAFGSSIVRYSQNKKLATEYKKAAIEASKMRATQSLLELLKGSNECWYSGLYEGTASGDVSSEYNSINEKVTDLPNENNEIKAAVAQVSSSEFLDVFMKTSAYKSTSQGMVPAGVIIQTATDPSVEENGYGWVYTVAVYYPELSLDAQNLYNAMSNRATVKKENPVTIMVNTSSESSDNPQGPSGTVSDDDNL